MRLTTLLRAADPLPTPDTGLSARARSELRALVGPEPSPIAITTGGGPRRPRTVRALVVAGAVLAVVAVVTVPLLQRPVSGVPAPAGTPTPAAPTASAPEARWVEIAPGPLGGRRDPVTAWVDGSFIVVGGTATPPCTDTAGCEADDVALADGARYTPASDSWEPVADAPIPLLRAGGPAHPYPGAVTIGDTVYLVQGGAFLAYNATSNRWATLPTPPDDVVLAGTTSDELIAYPTSQCGGTAGACGPSEAMTWYSYQPATAGWKKHTADLSLPTPNPYGATVVGDRLVVSWLEGNTLGLATVDLGSGTVTHHPSLGTSQRPVPVTVGDWAAWTRDQDTAWFLNPATGELSMADLPTPPGPLRVTVGAWERYLPVTTAGMVGVGGQLFDPGNGRWSTVPVLPVAAQDPVVVAGPDSLLACGGWDGAGYAAACHLLHPAPATLTTP